MGGSKAEQHAANEVRDVRGNASVSVVHATLVWVRQRLVRSGDPLKLGLGVRLLVLVRVVAARELPVRRLDVSLARRALKPEVTVEVASQGAAAQQQQQQQMPHQPYSARGHGKETHTVLPTACSSRQAAVRLCQLHVTTMVLY